MTRTILTVKWTFLLGALPGTWSAEAVTATERVLFDFEKGPDVSRIEARDVKVDLIPGAAGRALRLRTGHAIDWPGITLEAPDGKWDLSAYRYLALDLRNVGTSRVWVGCRVDNPGADGRTHCVQTGMDLDPGEAKTLTVHLSSTPFRLSKPLKLIGMRGSPGHGALDPTNVIGLVIFVARPKEDHAFAVDNIRVGGTLKTLETDKFLPFIDSFGQFMHADWPGKIHNIGELRAAARREGADLRTHPGPADRDRYGGWKDGPKREATGSFRVEKYNGKWWLVDPDGRLFWSHGVDCVTPNDSTPISDREEYFADLPPKDSPLAAFYGRGTWAPHGYYKDHTPYRTYDFLRANLARKYGDDWLPVRLGQ